MSEATKYDTGKNRLELIPPEFIEGVAHVLTFGANKYGDFNWTKGLKYSRIIGALMRHLLAFIKGERLDKESGLPHLWHVGCNLAFLITFEAHAERYKDFNNLPSYEELNDLDIPL